MVFSSLFACPECGHSITELEPRLFSFNNPAGACESCDGLGMKQYFDQKKVIIDDGLSLAEGAVRGWDRRNIYYFQLLKSLADHYGFAVDIPYKKLSKKHQDLILSGSGNTDIEFTFINDKGKTYINRKPFEGILPNMERRYRETESQMVREELAKYLNSQPCPECSGTRLRRDARHVLINKKNLPTITDMTIGNAANYFATLNLKGKKAQIAEKILKEILDRLQFLVDVAGLAHVNTSIGRADGLQLRQSRHRRRPRQADIRRACRLLQEGLHQCRPELSDPEAQR